MKRYLKYFEGVKKYAILAPIFMMVDAMCSVVSPYIISKIIDVGIANGDTSYIMKMGGIMFLLALGVLGGGFGCMYFSAKASYGFGANLRKDIIRKIQEFSFANINKFTTASIITRATNDVEVLVQLVQMCLRMLIRSPFMFVGGIIMAVTLNKGMSLIIVALIPLLAMIIAFAILKAFPLFTKVQEKIDRVNSILRENLVGSRFIKAFVREKHEEQRFKNANQELRDLSVKSFGVMVLLMPGVTLIMNLGIASVLWFGGKLALTGAIQVGQISSYVTYITMVLSALMMLMMMFMNLSRSKASAARITEILTEDPDIKDNVDSVEKRHKITKGKVEYNVKKFAFADSEGEAILENIKFNAKPGEMVAIIGSTGTGKSTIVNLMPRFYDVTEGYVKIDGVDVRDYDLKNLRDGIGMVLQENRLFSGTIRSNLLWGNENATDEEIYEALRIAQMEDHVKNMKEGLDSKVEQRGTNFSGGQKQRLTIARALVKKPKILIMDDSVSALDATTEKNLREALRREMKDTTIFVITQRISSCKEADKILVVDDGTIVGQGTHDELIVNNKVYKEISDSQNQEVRDDG
ncbi:MAG: ABC transporter ATP-binding protein [Clostridia bacterium]|nr:ABC transporter ATP-binding protein [Clostridia bacterium]